MSVHTVWSLLDLGRGFKSYFASWSAGNHSSEVQRLNKDLSGMMHYVLCIMHEFMTVHSALKMNHMTDCQKFHKETTTLRLEKTYAVPRHKKGFCFLVCCTGLQSHRKFHANFSMLHEYKGAFHSNIQY